MRKRRLLFLISRFLDGGIDTVLVEYLRNIDSSRYDVTLAIGMRMAGREVHLGKLPSSVNVEYLVKSEFLTATRRRKLSQRLPWYVKLYDEALLNPVRRIVSTGGLRRLIARHDAVVDFDATFYTFLRRCPRPVVGFYHFSIEENLRRSPRHTRRQMDGMARYRNIALISDAMMEEGRRLFPGLAPKFVRIYNGYNLPGLRQRAEAPLPEEFTSLQPYFLSVARLEESQKDNATLIKAYALMLRKLNVEPGQPSPRLVLVGDGRDRDALHRLAADEGVAEKVVFAGFQPDALPWMARSLALVLSSRYEGFGLVLVEAMSLGIPVMATDCPSGPAEILEDGRAGLLCPVGDVERMAGNLLRLLGDENLRRHLSSEAVRRSEDFDIRRSVDQLTALLN